VNWSSLVLVFHCLSRPWKVCPGWVAPYIASFCLEVDSSFCCGMLKSLFMFIGLSTLTGQHTPGSHTLVPVIHDECILVLGHPLQLMPSCRNVGAHWYLRDSHIPDQDPYVVGHVLEFTSTSLHTHILQQCSVRQSSTSLNSFNKRTSACSNVSFTLVNYFFTDSTAPSCCSKCHESSHNKFLKIPTTGHSQLQKLSCGYIGGGGEEPPL